MPRHSIVAAAAWLAALTACGTEPPTVPDPTPPALASNLDFGPSIPTWTISNIPLLPGTHLGLPQDISDDGVVVGYAVAPSYVSHAFYWTGGGGTQPLPLGPYNGASRAMGISDNGRYMVGFGGDGDGTNVAIRWERLRAGGIAFHTLRTCSGPGATAYAVTNDGVVIGKEGSFAVKWTSLTSCSTPIDVGGKTMWAAHDINDGGVIVGATTYAKARGFVTPSTLGFLQPLPGDTASRATGINEWGEIVGLSLEEPNFRATYRNPYTGETFALGTANPLATGYPRISDRGRTIWENAPGSGRTTRGTEIRSLMMAPTGVNTCGDIVGATAAGQGQIYKKTVCDP